MKGKRSTLIFGLIVFAIFGIALLLRLDGLFRGLTYNYSFHPDAPKQIAALGNFLQGHYVWYVGSLFYDGYPLGLNHLDEALLRFFMVIRNACVALLSPEAQLLDQPEKLTLYYWAQSLRVLYGLFCLGLLYKLTHRIFQNRGIALSALVLAAISPLAIVVCHSATGDIGVDLFSLITLSLLTAYAHHPRKGWLLLAGFATGLAFSCKYQGALAGIAIGLFILLEWVADRRLLKAGLSSILAICGGFLGMLAGTPALFINWGRTMKNMRANFEFIQHYNVSPEFLAQPMGTRLLYGLTENTPATIGALGWTISLLAFAGLIMATRQFIQSLKPAGRIEADRPKAGLILSVIAFPFLALVISLAGKPYVQPFHFSYLQPALIFGAVYALRNLWHQGFHQHLPRLLAAVLFIVATAESARITQRESFFWSRGDNFRWADHLAGEAFRETQEPVGKTGIIKTVYLESGGLAVFRNRATVATAPDAALWNQIHIAPVPTVPLELDQDWLFPNGPVFPRNDRSFKIRQDAKASRHVVLYASPGAMKFGLRSGSWPTEITLTYGGTKHRVSLTPHSQTILTVAPSRWKHSQGNAEVPAGCSLVPLVIQTRGGSAWATVLADEREARVFNFYGGLVQDPKLSQPSDIPSPELCQALNSTRFLEGEESADLIPAEEPAPGYRFPKSGMALPCGPYELECVVQCQSPTAEISLKLDDLHKCQELTPFETTRQLKAGYQVLTVRFDKAFVPYETQLEIKALQGRCRLLSWSLRPDVAQIQKDLQGWTKDQIRPAWLTQTKGTHAPGPAWDQAGVTFGGKIRLVRLNVPAIISKREPVLIHCEMALTRFGFPRLEDHVFFIHLLDAQGHTVHTFNFPIWKTIALGALNIPFQFEPPTQLPPGDYALELGAYNTRIEKRLTIESANLSKIERRKNHHVFGRLTLTE